MRWDYLIDGSKYTEDIIWRKKNIDKKDFSLLGKDKKHTNAVTFPG